jgi:hypothetical protein
VLVVGCSLPRGVLGASAADGALPDAAALDARVPIDAPATDASDATTPDAPVLDVGPIDAWSDTGPPPCTPSPEACNLYDDDCDGSVDEDTCGGCTRMEHGGRVYQLCPNAVGFDAWNECASLGPGYHLLDERDMAEATFVRDWLAGSWAWIGLNDIHAENTFVWADGSTPSFTWWQASEPNGHEGENCAVQAHDGWVDFGCANSVAVMCVGDPRATPLPAGVAETCNGHDDDLDGSVDEGACACDTFVFDGHVYEHCTATHHWDTARMTCTGDGYTMVVVDTRTESEMIGHSLPGGSWSGLTDEAMEMSWVYESAPMDVVSNGATAAGSHFVYWLGGQPDDAGGSHHENCAWIDGGGHWWDGPCGDNWAALCERAIVP